MNDLRLLLQQAKQQGINIKYIATQTDINVTTLYSFSCGRRNLSKEKAEKVLQFLNTILNKG